MIEHPLFRRRLAKLTDVETKQVKHLIETHGSYGRPEKVGMFFQPLNHNYLYGVTRKKLVEQMLFLHKKLGLTLSQIFDLHPWQHEANKQGARDLAKFGFDEDRYVVRLAEIMIGDLEERYEKLNDSLKLSVPVDLVLFWWVFGQNYKALALATAAGIGVSEGVSLFKNVSGLSGVQFTIYGVIVAHLFKTGKLVSLPAAVLAILAFGPLVTDPPFREGKAALTDHLTHYTAMATGFGAKYLKFI